MLVYVIVRGHHPAAPDARLPAVRAVARSCPGSGSTRPSRTACGSIVSRERLIKQIYFPKLVLPVSATMAGVVSFAFGLMPLLLVYGHLLPGAPARAWLLLIPVVVAVQLVFSLGDRDRASRRSTCSTATSATSRATCSGSGSTCRRRCTRPSSSTSSAEGQPDHRHPVQRSTRGPYLFGAYRDLLFYGQAPPWSSLGILLAFSVVLGLAGRLLFKRASRRSPRCCDGDGRRSDEPARGGTRRHPRRPARREVQPAPDEEADAPRLDHPPRAPGGRPGLLGPSRRVVHGAPGRVAGRHRAQRRRQEHAAPGAGRHPDPVRRARSRSTATSRAC